MAHELGHWIFGDAYNREASLDSERMINSARNPSAQAVWSGGDGSYGWAGAGVELGTGEASFGHGDEVENLACLVVADPSPLVGVEDVRVDEFG